MALNRNTPKGQGYEAYLTGVPLYHNPYSAIEEGTDGHDWFEWMMGWEMAKEAGKIFGWNKDSLHDSAGKMS